MSEFFASFVSFIHYLAQILPLELFVFFGSMIEEIVGPIPSPLIMTTGGSLAQSKHLPAFYLLLLAVLGSLGKILVSYGLYYLGDKAEDVVVGKYGKYLGVQQSSIDKLRSYFSQNWKDDVVLFLLRSIPIFPTGTVSIVCGVLKYPMRSFLTISAIGFVVRGMIYLVIGYYGLESIKELFSTITVSETILLFASAALFAILFVVFKKRQSHSSN